jgi:methylase of polypeptide subunit release factors
MNTIKLKEFGSINLPERYRHLAHFPLRQEDASNPSRVVKALSRGQAVVVSGCTETLTKLMGQVTKHREQLTPRPEVPYPGKRDWDRAFREVMDRVLTVVEDEALPASMLTGEEIKPPYLSPAAEFIRTQDSIGKTHFIPVLGHELSVHHQVLVPRSHQTLAIFRDAFSSFEAGSVSRVLDMGCGSGVLSLLAARELSCSVIATDHLPEAIATTGLNVREYEAKGLVRPGSICITPGGDLFTPVSGSFDLVLFNAPWVVAPAHNPAETALNDPEQRILTRFMAELPSYLNPGGRLLLGYSDNSGPKAIARVEELISQYGLVLERVWKNRIRTWRKNRAWQNIFVYQARTP